MASAGKKQEHFLSQTKKEIKQSLNLQLLAEKEIRLKE